MEEIVEEEAVLDDLHLIDEQSIVQGYDQYQGQVYQEEIAPRELDVERDEQPQQIHPKRPQSYIVTIKEVDPSKSFYRIPVCAFLMLAEYIDNKMTNISSTLYDLFCYSVLDGEEAVHVPQSLREQFECIYHSGDWAVGRHIFDEFLGMLDPVMVHVPTKKFLLRPEDRTRLLDAIVVSFKNEKNPVSVALQSLMKSYVGFPPLIQLRDRLALKFSTQSPLDASLPEKTTAIAVQRLGTRRGRGWKGMRGGRGRGGASTSATQLHTNALPPPSLSSRCPIPDQYYDLVATVIAQVVNLDEVKDPASVAIVRDNLKEDLEADQCSTNEDGMAPGWRIRDRTTGKIIPPRGKVDEIWSHIHDSLIHSHTLAEIVNYAESKYIGVVNPTIRRMAKWEDIYKGTRVSFPHPPVAIGTRAMQFVQIDIIDMDQTEYSERGYSSALIVSDLYSRFVFGRAMTVEHEEISSVLLRHMMDIFSNFAPPEAYRSYTNQTVIHDVMEEVGRLFKIHSKNAGMGMPLACHRQIRSFAYRRAELEWGSKLRWVEALAFAVMDVNQRPCTAFRQLASPFEVLFGRRPWSGPSTIPPWVFMSEEERAELDDKERERNRKIESEEERRSRISEMLAHPRVMYENVNDEEGDDEDMIDVEHPGRSTDRRIIDPGTGIRYEVGDKVYVRNPHLDASVPRKGSKDECRYFRGRVAQLDDSQPDFFYRIVFWHDCPDVDSIDPRLWPSLESDSEWMCSEGWFSPWDVASSTYDQHYRRDSNVHIRRLCRCGTSNRQCERRKAEDCERQRNKDCCIRTGGCSIHTKGEETLGNKRNLDDDPRVRYIIKDGTVVRVKPEDMIPAKRARGRPARIPTRIDIKRQL